MKPIIELLEKDFGDILQFPLLWRWNSKTHAKFSPEQLQAIRPLTIQAASKLHNRLKHLHQPGGLNPSATYDLRKINAEQNEEAMKTWGGRIGSDQGKSLKFKRYNVTIDPIIGLKSAFSPPKASL